MLPYWVMKEILCSTIKYGKSGYTAKSLPWYIIIYKNITYGPVMVTRLSRDGYVAKNGPSLSLPWYIIILC